MPTLGKSHKRIYVKTRFLPIFAFLAMLCATCMAYGQTDLRPPSPFGTQWIFVLHTAAGPISPNSVVQVRYTGADSKNYDTLLVSKDAGNITLYSDVDIQNITFIYDDPSTPSADGIWAMQLDNGSRQSRQAMVNLEPIGDVAGVLLDADGNVATGATVQITCPNGFSSNISASQVGAFSFTHVPAGTCLVAAYSNKQSAQSSIGVKAGDFQIINLRLSNQNALFPAIAAGIVIVLFGGALTYAKLKAIKRQDAQKTAKTRNDGKGAKSKNAKNKPSAPSQKSFPSLRQSDLLATLPQKEKDIVEYVARLEPTAVKTAKIRKDLFIPKTSLTRTLQSLERKQFLRLEKMDSRMYAKLHDFFKRQ